MMQNCKVPDFLNETEMDLPKLSNKYVYFKQNFIPTAIEPTVVSSKVLINPHFNKKVFVNPNFRPNNMPLSAPGKIHINPNVTSINLPKDNGHSKIHINPKILRTVPGSVENTQTSTSNPEPVKQPLTYSSKTKLIRKPVKEQTTRRIRRSSVYSKFKIVKSSVLNKSRDIKYKNNLLFNSKYKLKRVSSHKSEKNLVSQNLKLKNRFKLDNRKKHGNISSRSKFVFINKFISIIDIANRVPLRTKSLVNISGIMYKNSPNRLQRTSLIQQDRKRSSLSLSKQVKPLKKNTFKIVRISPAKPILGKKKVEKKIVSRYSSRKLRVPAEKLKKCNIPCPYYRKFGKCKGKEQGKCPRKHDPDQIALCTKFLQGACIDPKCLLSHNVSPEKMPTCKYYLEGSCSKENCPYLHVRISPKADICRDFLEGFCKEASECHKRHQFLCPDYEKKGTCLKPRCSYPHGRMVRKYSVFNKHKFAKKSSVNIKQSTASTSKGHHKVELSKKEETAEPQAPTATRYYSDKNVENEQNSIESKSGMNFRFRPKLGELPSFISLEDM